MDIEIKEWLTVKAEYSVEDFRKHMDMRSVYVIYLNGMAVIQLDDWGEAIETAKMIRGRVDKGVVDGYIRRVVI